MSKPVLTADAVHAIVRECLFSDKELAETTGVPDHAVAVHGIVVDYGFNPAELAANKDKIRAMLLELPREFQQSGGGGWSFLNACNDKYGHQWGEHSTMEALCCLGVAVDLVQWCLPREFWSMLPGGVPYFVVLDTPAPAEDDSQPQETTGPCGMGIPEGVGVEP